VAYYQDKNAQLEKSLCRANTVHPWTSLKYNSPVEPMKGVEGLHICELEIRKETGPSGDMDQYTLVDHLPSTQSIIELATCNRTT
jgi:hypothetical protein